MDVKTRFYFIDLLISTFFFTPLVVMFWHGTFGVFDFILLHQSPKFGPWVIFVLGIIIQVAVCGFQREIKSMVASRAEKRLCLVAYNYVMATAQILQFRGLNDIYDQFMGAGVYDAITATCTAIVILFGTKLTSQVTDMPLCITLDTDMTLDGGFGLDTYYNTEKGATMHHFLDAIGTYAVMQTFVHTFSIAAWVAVDSGFFPWDPFLAMMSSWILGHGLLLGLGYFMPRLQKLSQDALSTDVPLVGSVFVNILILGQGLGVVMAWHGHWVLYDVIKRYMPVYHAGYDVTAFYEVIASFAILALCQVSSVLVRRGLASDVIEDCVDGLCGQWDYFSHYYKDEIDGKSGENNNRSGSGEKDTIREIAKASVGSSVPLKKKDVTIQDLIDIDRKKQEKKKTN